MTGPFPGQGDIPQPWGGRPPPREPGYYSSYGEQEPAYGGQDAAAPPWESAQSPGYGGYDGPFQVPPRGPSRKVTAALVVALVVVVGGGVALWWFAAGPGRGGVARQVAVTRSNPPAPAVLPVVSSSATPNNAAAYDVGSCFDETQGVAPGKVELNPVACGGEQAVFVINRVVDTMAGCDVGADYKGHGYEVPDETANVAYCASLVVPADYCFTLAASRPVERTACGSGPGVVKVLAIESAPGVGSACTDKTNPDVWYYQSPVSGQFACVSRPGPGGSSSVVPTTG